MWLLLGCVVGGGESEWSFEDPASISAYVANGEISVTSSYNNTAYVHWEGGGFGQNAKPSVGMEGGEVYIDADGGLLGGGEMQLEAPAEVPLELIVDRGSVDVRLDFPTSINACVGAGDVSIAVPPGGYFLDLDVALGASISDDIYHDPSSPYVIYACVGAGSVEVNGREAKAD